MANSRQAKKRILVNEKKRMHNLAIRSSVKSAVKKARKAIEDKDENTLTIIQQTIKIIDKAACKGIVHKNTAARKKSRLMKYYHKVSA